MQDITADDVINAVDSQDFDANGYEYDVIEYVDKLTDVGVEREIQDAFAQGYFKDSDNKEKKITGVIQYIAEGVQAF